MTTHDTPEATEEGPNDWQYEWAMKGKPDPLAERLEERVEAWRAITVAQDADIERLLVAWRRTKDFLRDRLVSSGRSDVSINAVLRVMNSAFADPSDEPKP